MLVMLGDTTGNLQPLVILLVTCMHGAGDGFSEPKTRSGLTVTTGRTSNHVSRTGESERMVKRERDASRAKPIRRYSGSW